MSARLLGNIHAKPFKQSDFNPREIIDAHGHVVYKLGYENPALFDDVLKLLNDFNPDPTAFIIIRHDPNMSPDIDSVYLDRETAQANADTIAVAFKLTRSETSKEAGLHTTRYYDRKGNLALTIMEKVIRTSR